MHPRKKRYIGFWNQIKQKKNDQQPIQDESKRQQAPGQQGPSQMNPSRPDPKQRDSSKKDQSQEKRIETESQEAWLTNRFSMNFDDLKMSVKIEKMLYEEKYGLQRIQIFENKSLGRCLALDGALQFSELDECSYQEMISFLPLNLHQKPLDVLIIGGGDGGVARECHKHPSVKRIVLCELDIDVIECCRDYLPFISSGLASNKLALFIQDGFSFVQEHPSEFDVIITDCTDADDQSQILFTEEYFRALYQCLRPNGIICSQVEGYWLETQFIRKLFHKIKSIFPSVAYASTSVVSYPGGMNGFILASKEKDLDFKQPRHQFTAEQMDDMNLKFYSMEMHQASFVLPRFFQKQLEDNPETTTTTTTDLK